MKHRTVPGALAATLVLGMGFAQAAPDDNSGWYAGIDLARSNLGSGGRGIDGAVANQGIAGSASISNQDTGAGLTFGYRFGKSFALEGGYIDLGKYKYSSFTTAPAADTVQGIYKAHALSFSAVGILPMNNKWSLFGKAGLTRTSAELSARSVTGATAPGGASASGIGLLVGAGATYDFAKNWFGKAELDRYTHVGDPANTGPSDVNVFSLGMGLRF
ncbi:MAG: outer membrane beta-barrel protein [Pseudomonadota bacterium]